MASGSATAKRGTYLDAASSLLTAARTHKEMRRARERFYAAARTHERAVLACVEDLHTASTIARALGVSRPVVARTIQRAYARRERNT